MKPRARSVCTAAAVLALALPAGLAGQLPLRFALGATSGQWHVSSTFPGGSEELSAPMIGFEGVADVWRLGLEVRYLQADLDPSTVSTLTRESADLRLMLAVRPTSWLSVGTGPHLRSYVTSIGTQRWRLWEVMVRGQAFIIPDLAKGYAEVWGVVAHDVNVEEDWDYGEGADVGMVVALPRPPLWIKLGYRIELYRLGDGARREVTDGLMVSLGLGRAW